MSVNWECKYCGKILESGSFNIEGNAMEVVKLLENKINYLSEQCECRKEFKKEQINDDKCPKCGYKLDWTYEIDESKKLGDHRIYGIVCTRCGYEKYDK